MRTLIASILTFGILTGGITAQQPPRAPAREIVNAKGDIYRARNNNYFSLFMVTPEGIILADPINAAFATWMKEQFAERFKVPVKYVIYSHSHWDHIEGGAIFIEELQKSLLFEKYKDWNGYAARRAATIDSAYRNLQMYK